MNLTEFEKLVKNNGTSPVVLLEGKRNINSDDKNNLPLLGYMLSMLFPYCYFRTGNASGADELFAKGVAEENPSRLQVILPYSKHRLKHRFNKAQYYTADSIPYNEEPNIYDATIAVNRKYREMYDHYFAGVKNKYSVKAPYLLRDTVKVLGSKTLGLSAAGFGIFYDDLEKPMSGGTGHTMKVCRNNKIPFVDQQIWTKWIDEFLEEEGLGKTSSEIL